MWRHTANKKFLSTIQKNFQQGGIPHWEFANTTQIKMLINWGSIKVWFIDETWWVILPARIEKPVMIPVDLKNYLSLQYDNYYTERHFTVL